MTAAIAIGGRRSGKALATRITSQSAAWRGEHVHVAGPGGQWCLRPQVIGVLLYVRIR